MLTKKLTIVVFTYRGEEELLPMTIARLRQAIPEGMVHIVDDADDPLPKTVWKRMRELGCDYKASNFPRNYNLNGKDCIVGELEAMRECMDYDKNTDGYLLKIDPDTLVLRPDYVLDCLAQDVDWLSHTSDKGVFAGMLYAMKRHILEAALTNARSMTFPEYCPEDQVIGALCYIAACKSSYSHTVIRPEYYDTAFSAVPMNIIDKANYTQSLLFCALHGHILTVGNAAFEGYTKSWQVKVCHDLLRLFYNLPELESQFTDEVRAQLAYRGAKIQGLPIIRNQEDIKDPVTGERKYICPGNDILTGKLATARPFTPKGQETANGGQTSSVPQSAPPATFTDKNVPVGKDIAVPEQVKPVQEFAVEAEVVSE